MKPIKLYNNIEIDNKYFDNYGGASYADNYKTYTIPAEYLIKELVDVGLDFETFLDIGCASGELVRDLRKLGIKAFGIDNNEYILKKNVIPECCKQLDLRNISDLHPLKFDITYANSLMYVFPQEVIAVLKKLKKIVKKAVYLWTPYLDDNFQFNDPYRKFQATKSWWNKQFEEAGFKKSSNQNIYLI